MSDGRLLATSGFVAVAGNVLAVALLWELPSSYRVGELASWFDQVVAHPQAAAASAVAFTIGLIGLALWGRHTGRAVGTPAARFGGEVLAVGSLMNAAGTVTPLVLGLHLGADAPRPVGEALLGVTLALDALFNLTLAVGLLLMASTWPSFRPMSRLKWLAVAAALASLPVSAQAFHDDAASLLALSGPLWLILVTAVSIIAWRNDARFLSA